MTFLTKKDMVTFLGFNPAAIFVQLERLFAPPSLERAGQIIPIVVNSENCEILFCLSNKAVCVVSEKNSENKNFLFCYKFYSKISKFCSLYSEIKFRMLWIDCWWERNDFRLGWNKIPKVKKYNLLSRTEKNCEISAWQFLFHWLRNFLNDFEFTVYH